MPMGSDLVHGKKKLFPHEQQKSGKTSWRKQKEKGMITPLLPRLGLNHPMAG